MSLLVVVHCKRKKSVWEVVDSNDNCKVLASDFNTSQEAHSWIDKQNALKEV
jgi:hypothetical protein